MPSGPSPTEIQDAAAILLADFGERSRTRRRALASARLKANGADRASAEAAYRDLIAREPGWADAWAGLAACLADEGCVEGALEAVCRALALDPAGAAGHYVAGRLAAVTSVASRARAAHADALHVGRERKLLTAWNESALVRLAEADVDGAIVQYRRAASRSPEGRTAMRQLAVAWAAKGDDGQSALWAAYAAHAEGAYDEAVEALEHALSCGHRAAEVHLALVDSWRALREYARALTAADRARGEWPEEPAIVRAAAETLHALGRTAEARRVLRAATRRGVGGLALKRVDWLMVPAVYDRERDINRYRRRYAAGVDRLLRVTDLKTAAGRREAEEALLASTSVHLAYQNQDDRGLQERLGAWSSAVMAANHPEWNTAPDVPVPASGERLRIGYATADCRRHSTANTHLGWLRHADRTRFEIYCYHLGEATDVVTDDFRRFSDWFRHVPRGFDAAPAIRADRLHALVYLDIGLHPRVSALAALRLAPLQATTWGHPVTSGLPTIDYYLSAAGMEAADADAHYGERLVRLPATGVSYERPPVPQGRASRRQWGLSDDDVLYFCGQSPLKYLPQHDRLLLDVARRVPSAKLVFLNTHAASPRLFERIGKAFSEAGMAFEASCVVLPRLSAPECLRLMTAVDVFLDTPGWSGANTTFEAMAAGIPVVTWPGRWMRGRHSLAILEAAGATETVAADEDAYVDIAVRLGLDRAWRHEVGVKVRHGSDRLWRDRRCVQALEEFFDRVVRMPLARSI